MTSIKQGKMMKKLLILILFTSLYFVFGCMEQNQVAGPQTPDQIEKKSIPVNEINWVTLPRPDKNSLAKKFKRGSFIDIRKGGKMKIDTWYYGGIHEWVEVWAEIKFDKKSIKQGYSFYEDVNYVFSDNGKKLWFTMEIDDETTTGTFTPHIMFDKPIELSMEFRGLDLTGMDPDKFEFVYIPEGSDQAFVPKYKKFKVDIDKGKITVHKAEIPHFSRYGTISNN